ncbi:MAG: hypothetical protein IKY47_03965 [Bacteroidaceae bacterium]|nr:hypothetical protein [Bacteroidaceae bacterium]
MKKNILAIAAIMLSCILHAQTDTLRAVVNVSNEYNPVQINVNKRNFTPTISTPTRTATPEYGFTTEAIPYKGFVSERATGELFPTQESPYNGYVRLGYGVTNELDLKASYGIDLTARDNIRFAGSMDGFKKELYGVFNEWDSRMYNSTADIGYTHTFNKLWLDIAGNFNNRVFNYQNAGFSQFVTDKQNSKNYGLHVKGASTALDGYGYSFNAAFTHNCRKYSTGVAEGIAESGINAGGGAWYKIGDSELRGVGILLNADVFLYNSTLRKSAYGYDNYCSVDIDPYLDFNFGGWDLRLGTRMNFVTANSAVFAISPDIRLRKAFNEYVAIFVKGTGGREDNNFSKLESLTPYWGFDKEVSRQLKPTYKVLDASAGTTITLEQLSIDLTAGYAFTKDDLLQQMELLETFSQHAFVYSNLAQENTHDAFITARVGYDYGGWLKLSGDARYDYWECDNHDLLVLNPELTFNFNAELKPLRGLTINAGYNYTRFTKGEEDTRLADKNDLSLRVSYNITSRLGAYIQGNNLLNKKYYQYAGYLTRGVHGVIGLTANF